jgi:hypothetical protein
MLTPMLLPPKAFRLRSAARLLAIAALHGTIILPTAAAQDPVYKAAAAWKAAIGAAARNQR